MVVSYIICVCLYYTRLGKIKTFCGKKVHKTTMKGHAKVKKK